MNKQLKNDVYDVDDFYRHKHFSDLVVKKTNIFIEFKKKMNSFIRSFFLCTAISPMSGRRCSMTKKEHKNCPERSHRTDDQREFWGRT